MWVQRPRQQKIEYDQHFLKLLLERHAYFNIRSDLRCSCCCCCTWFQTSFCPDMYFYFLNHSQLLGMVGALPEHPFTRSNGEWRTCCNNQLPSASQVYLPVLISNLYELRYFYQGQEASVVLTSETQKNLINVVIISPFIMALYGFLVMLFSCPCTKFNFRWSIFKLLRDFIESSGDLVGTLVCIIVSLLCVAYVSLFDAESETTIYSRLEMLVNYALQVQVTSAVIDTLRCLLVFTPFYVDVKICCFVPILRLGDWVGQMRMSKSARYGTKPPSHTVCCVKAVYSMLGLGLLINIARTRQELYLLMKVTRVIHAIRLIWYSVTRGTFAKMFSAESCKWCDIRKAKANKKRCVYQ